MGQYKVTNFTLHCGLLVKASAANGRVAPPRLLRRPKARVIRGALRTSALFRACRSVNAFESVAYVSNGRQRGYGKSKAPLTVRLRNSCHASGQRMRNVSVISTCATFTVHIFNVRRLFNDVLHRCGIVQNVNMIKRLSKYPPLAKARAVHVRGIHVERGLCRRGEWKGHVPFNGRLAVQASQEVKVARSRRKDNQFRAIGILSVARRVVVIIRRHDEILHFNVMSQYLKLRYTR